MNRYPTMSFKRYLTRFASETRNGCFFCQICKAWIEKQRWIHFKLHHRWSD